MIQKFDEFINESKIVDEKDLVYVHASKLSIGDYHQYLDDNDKWKVSKVKLIKPLKNGFNEIIGATITWDDNSKGEYRGDLQIQSK